MTTLNQFRATHRVVSAAEFEADENRPVDLCFYPNATPHAYKCSDHDAVYYIVQMEDGFHYTFMHPADDIAPTLADAERELHAFLIAEMSN